MANLLFFNELDSNSNHTVKKVWLMTDLFLCKSQKTDAFAGSMLIFSSLPYLYCLNMHELKYA